MRIYTSRKCANFKCCVLQRVHSQSDVSFFLFPTFTTRSVLYTHYSLTQASSSQTQSQLGITLSHEYIFYFYFIFPLPTFTARSVLCTDWHKLHPAKHNHSDGITLLRKFIFCFIFPPHIHSSKCFMYRLTPAASSQTQSQWWHNIIAQVYFLFYFPSPHSQLEVFYVQIDTSCIQPNTITVMA